MIRPSTPNAKLGQVTEFVDEGIPPPTLGWEIIDSQTLEIAKYPEAYKLYGNAISSTHFTLPSRQKPDNLSSYYIYMGET